MIRNITENYLDLTGYQMVIEEMENAIALYPDYLSQRIFGTSELRQKIITDVINQVWPPDFGVKFQEKCSVKRKSPYRSLELRLKIEAIVHQSIQTIFKSELSLSHDRLSILSLRRFDVNLHRGDRRCPNYSRAIG